MQTIIFRVENDEGLGPYQTQWNGRETNLPWHHPNVRDECSYENETYAVCKPEFHGFSSVSQLKNWFYSNDHVAALNNAGFMVYIFYGNTITITKKQCTFERDKALRMYSVPWEALYDIMQEND